MAQVAVPRDRRSVTILFADIVGSTSLIEHADAEGAHRLLAPAIKDMSDAVESPHLNLGKARGELYISCAEHDELAPPDMVKELKKLFDASGAAGELEVHPGVHHGFAFPQRGAVYDKSAAERHWERLFALFRRNLG